MVSSTQQTQRIRARRLKNAGKRRKRQMRMGKTSPEFPIHQVGYDAKAADALPRAATKAPQGTPKPGKKD